MLFIFDFTNIYKFFIMTFNYVNEIFNTIIIILINDYLHIFYKNLKTQNVHVTLYKWLCYNNIIVNKLSIFLLTIPCIQLF